MQTHKPRIHEIDGLRGIAILSVVFLHWFVQPLSPSLSKSDIGGVLTLFAYGVDLFFVISGFLIGGILLGIGKRLSGTRAFYIRRILRIWPLYYLLLALTYVITRGNSLFAQVPYWSFYFFIFNFWESNGQLLHQALGPLWSIAIEEQFYAIGPLIFLILNRKQLTHLAVLYIILSPFLRLALLTNTNIGIWRFTPARLDGICIGILLSIILSSPTAVSFLSSKTKVLKPLTFLLFVLSVLSKVVLSRNIWFSFGNSLVVLALGCLLLTVQVQCLLNQNSRILNLAFLRYLGLRCYFIYLFHIFFMLIANVISENFFIALTIQIILTLGFTHISWRYLESPLIKLGQKFRYSDPLGLQS